MKYESVAALKEQFEQALESALARFQWNEQLQAAIRYAMSGGKRVRPLLVLALVHDVHGGVGESHLLPAVALEMLHTASLIHDDLPALDNDDLRRGRETVHRKFDEATALLSADQLVPYAISLCAQSGITSLTDTQRLQIIACLTRGYSAVCQGQMRDIALTTQSTRAQILEVHTLKTVALFQVAAELAAISGEFNEDIATQVCAIGKAFGSFFQLVDDLLDLEDDAPNIFRGSAVLEVFQTIDKSWLELDQRLLKLEALTVKRSCIATRELCDLVREKVSEAALSDERSAF